MRPGAKRWSVFGAIAVPAVIAVLAITGCDKTPEGYCQVLCDKMARCDIGIPGSSLRDGPSCRDDCVDQWGRIGVCPPGIYNLADCFDEQTCDTAITGCGSEVNAYVNGCE